MHMEKGKWKFLAKGVVQVTARMRSSQSTFQKGREPGVLLGQQMTSSGCDVGTSSLINFLGGPLPGQRSRAEMGPGPVGGSVGWRAGTSTAAGIRVFQSSGYSRPVGQVSPGAVTHLVSSSGMGRAHRPKQILKLDIYTDDLCPDPSVLLE